MTMGTAEVTVTEIAMDAIDPVKQHLELVKAGQLREFLVEMEKHPLNFTAGPDIFEDRTPLHMAALHGHVEFAKEIMASRHISVQVVNAKDRFGYTPLHLAVRSEHVEVVRILTTSTLTSRLVAATSERDELDKECDGFTPLHLAATVGNIDMVKLLLQQFSEDRVDIHSTTWQGITALDIAKKRNHVKLVELLECYDVNWLQLERQKSANSVNAILVGAALVATVTFESLLQPPLGIPNPDDSLQAYRGTAASPDSYEDSNKRFKINRDQVQMGWFLIITAFSFACSVVSLVIGTTAIIPSSGAPLKREVKQLRKSVQRASIFLFLAIFFLILAMGIGSRVVYRMVVSGHIVYTVGSMVLLCLPILILAFVLRYIVLPKGRFKLKKWKTAVFFVVALGLNIGILLAFSFIWAMDRSWRW